MIAIVCNGVSLLIFAEKYAQLWLWSKIRTKLVLGLYVPNATILLVYIPVNIKMNFIWKDDFFFAKIGIFCRSIERIGRSIGSNSWTNWTLYGVISRSLCTNASQWCLRNVQLLRTTVNWCWWWRFTHTFCHRSNILGCTHCFQMRMPVSFTFFTR